MDATNSPNAPDKYADGMMPTWRTVSDVTTGLPALANSAYLPIRPLERDKVHELRIKLADWLPFFDDTILACTGLIFRDEPTLGDDVPVSIAGVEGDKEKNLAAKEGWWENLDNAGAHGNVFLAQCTDIAIRYGHCVVMVENMPSLGPNADGAMEAASGRRPYCVKYLPEQVRNPFFTIENGRLVLEQITFVETTHERTGQYGQEEVTRYRTFIREQQDVNGQTLPRVRWIVEREIKEGEGKGEFYVESDGNTGLDEIPIAVIYGNKTGNLQSRPVFENLMYLNLSHFRKVAAYNYGVDRLQWSLLVAEGAEKKDVKLDTDFVIFVPQGCSANYIAPPADGANVATADLERLEKTMTAFGLQILLDESGGNKTAEEVKTSHSTRTSKISTIVKSVKDAAERILYFMALYGAMPGEKVTSGGSITIGGDVDDLALTPQELDTMLRAVESGNLPRLTWLQLVAPLVQKQVAEFDPKEADKELQGMEESVNAEIFRQQKAARQGQADNESAA